MLARVVDAFKADIAPLIAVEGYVRQVIGWREFIRGILLAEHAAAYAEMNAMQAELPMPRFFWTGETDMRRVAESLRQLIEQAYVHHIQRLIALGQFALLLGVKPYDDRMDSAELRALRRRADVIKTHSLAETFL